MLIIIMNYYWREVLCHFILIIVLEPNNWNGLSETVVLVSASTITVDTFKSRLGKHLNSMYCFRT